jgi:peptide-methionine (S)-S-oxide reductase
MAKEEIALLGGGCFWCIEAVYSRVRGVRSAVSGYAGGEGANPTYEAVCTGTTGHAEVVQMTFDPEEISFEELLDIFWEIHDPTTLNRQGADTGTQYRSVIFYQDEAQKAAAEASIERAQRAFDAPIVTELSPAPAFYAAEAYHQHYYALNPMQGYCRVVIAPKLQKFMQKFSDKLG